MSDKYEKIEFCEDSYRKSNGEVNNFEMFDDIMQFIQIALRNDYQLKIWRDELTVCAEYNYKDPSMAGVTLEWVDEDGCCDDIPDSEAEDDN